MNEKEKDQFDEAIRLLRSEEHERLKKRLEQIYKVDQSSIDYYNHIFCIIKDETNLTEAVKEAEKKTKDKRNERT